MLKKDLGKQGRASSDTTERRICTENKKNENVNKIWTGSMPTHEASRGRSAGPRCELNSHRTNSDQHKHL